MDTSGNGGKKLKHRLAAIFAAFSRRTTGRRRDDVTPLAFPSYSRLGGKKQASEREKELERRLSFPAPRAAPLVHITIDCAGRRSVDAADPSLVPLQAEAAKKKERRLTETGLFYETGEWEGRKCPPSSPFVTPVARRKEQRNKFLCNSSRKLISSSSSDDENDDPRNLFSSRSFSSDSSDFYNCPRKSKVRVSMSAACRPARRGASQSCRYSFELPQTVSRLSSASAADAGFAVVKRSADPYEDFRKSMEEMIAQWPVHGNGERDVERLLDTYLVLNSPRHYPAILTAFADVRDAFAVDRISLLS